MYTITQFSIAKLNNAEFVGYCVNLGNMIVRAEATQLGIETVLAADFESTKQKLIDQVYAATSSQYTIAMKTADAKRDKLVKKIFLLFQSICLEEQGSSVYTLRQKLETSILSKYSAAMTSMPQHEESAVIQGFIHDIQTEFDEDDIDDMGITSLLSNLEIANSDFITAYNDRSDERAAGDLGLTVKLRSQMQEIVTQIYFTVQFYANSALEANATKATACQDFIASVNVVLADVKKRWTQRTGNEPASSDTTDGTSNPDSPAGGNGTDTDTNNPAGGNSNPAGGNSNPDSGNDNPAGGNDNPAGGDSNPAGGSQPDGGPDPIVTDENAEF